MQLSLLSTPFPRKSPLWGTRSQPGKPIWNVSETSRARWTNEVKNKADNGLRFSSWNEKTKSLSWLPLQRNPSLDLIFVSSYKGWRYRQVVFKRKAFEIKWLPRISLHPGQMETFLLPLSVQLKVPSTLFSSLVPDLGWALWFVCGLGGCFCFLNNL